MPGSTPKPLHDLIAIQEKMNRLYEESLSKSPQEEWTTGFWSPLVDIYETEENLIIKAELPGLCREEVCLEVENNILTIKGERKFATEVKRENYHRLERAYGPFKRAFSLPDDIDEDQAGARFQDGVLEITLPKKEGARPRKILVSSY